MCKAADADTVCFWVSCCRYGTPDALRGVLCVTGASVEEIDATASGGEPYCFVVTEKQQADATTGEEGVSRRRQWILQVSQSGTSCHRPCVAAESAVPDSLGAALWMFRTGLERGREEEMDRVDARGQQAAQLDQADPHVRPGRGGAPRSEQKLQGLVVSAW